MKEIRIASLLYQDNNVRKIQEILRFDAEANGFKFVYDENSPDYVLVTNSIYDNRKLYKKFQRYIESDCILIYFSGECATPDMNVFDYAIAFDRYLCDGDRIARLSTLRFYSISLFDEYMNKRVSQELISTKDKFCNFMYSHSFPKRDELFWKLSEYKTVDSIGKHLNNTGAKNTRHSSDWRRLSIEDRLSYKFSIAAENACFPGYVSEKILSCLQAHTIPIYWGDPTIKEEFNVKAFVNCADFENFDQVLERVKEIDNNEDLYNTMLQQPWQTDEQKTLTAELDAKYDSWILNIFSQSKECARRRPMGTYPSAYRRWHSVRYKRDLKTHLKQFVASILYAVGKWSK